MTLFIKDKKKIGLIKTSLQRYSLLISWAVLFSNIIDLAVQTLLDGN